MHPLRPLRATSWQLNAKCDDDPVSVPPSPGSPLRNPGFRLLWGGQGLSQFGFQFQTLAMPVIAVTLLHATEFQVGVLTAAETAAFLVVGLPAGA